MYTINKSVYFFNRSMFFSKTANWWLGISFRSAITGVSILRKRVSIILKALGSKLIGRYDSTPLAFFPGLSRAVERRCISMSRKKFLLKEAVLTVPQ